MDTKLQKPRMNFPSRRHSRLNPSLSLTPTQFPDTRSITKINNISIFRSTSASIDSELYPPLEMSLKHPQLTGSSQVPSDPPSFPLLTPFSFPNPTTELSPSIREEVRQYVHCISPLSYVCPPSSSSTTPSSETSGKIALNPFYQKQELDGSKPTYVKLPTEMS